MIITLHVGFSQFFDSAKFWTIACFNRLHYQYDLPANGFALILLCSPIVLVQKANSCLAKSATVCHFYLFLVFH